MDYSVEAYVWITLMDISCMDYSLRKDITQLNMDYSEQYPIWIIGCKRYVYGYQILSMDCSLSN